MSCNVSVYIYTIAHVSVLLLASSVFPAPATVMTVMKVKTTVAEECGMWHVAAGVHILL